MTAQFRRASLPDVLQLDAMLWHAWTSLGCQVPASAKERTRNEQRRKRSRETPRAREDYVRRKKQRSGQGFTTHSTPCVYQCPLAPCPRPEKSFDLQGVFSHL